MADYPECEHLRGRLREICRGETALPRSLENKYRKLFGCEPLDMVAKSGAVPVELLKPAAIIGLDASGATAVYQDGVLKWERMDGLGDLVASILRHTRADKLIKIWIQWWYGKTCGCARRQEWLNRWFPFEKWLQREIRILFGTEVRLE